MVAALAAHTAGATLVPVNTRFTGAEALDVIAAAGRASCSSPGRSLAPTGSAPAGCWPAIPAAGELRLIVSIPVEPRRAGRRASWHVRTRYGRATARQVAVEDAAPRRGAGGRDQPGRRQRHPVHVRDHRAEQGRDELAPPGAAVAAAWAECGERHRADRYLVLNPFFHSFGYKAGILVCLLTGATIVPQLVYDPGRPCG